jgi:hypothetical protein
MGIHRSLAAVSVFGHSVRLVIDIRSRRLFHRHNIESVTRLLLSGHSEFQGIRISD